MPPRRSRGSLLRCRRAPSVVHVPRRRCRTPQRPQARCAAPSLPVIPSFFLAAYGSETCLIPSGRRAGITEARPRLGWAVIRVPTCALHPQCSHSHPAPPAPAGGAPACPVRWPAGRAPDAEGLPRRRAAARRGRGPAAGGGAPRPAPASCAPGPRLPRARNAGRAQL